MKTKCHHATAQPTGITAGMWQEWKCAQCGATTWRVRPLAV